jgi:hypothetical protein
MNEMALAHIGLLHQREKTVTNHSFDKARRTYTKV